MHLLLQIRGRRVLWQSLLIYSDTKWDCKELIELEFFTFNACYAYI